MTVATSRRNRKPRTLTPATGRFRWLVKPGVGGQPGWLKISVMRSSGEAVAEIYRVAENRDAGTLLGYRLTKKDGTTYDLAIGPDVWELDCPDYVHGRAHATTPETRECKHCRAVRQATATLNQ